MGVNFGTNGELITICYFEHSWLKEKYPWIDKVLLKKYKKNIPLPFEDYLSLRVHGWPSHCILEYDAWGFAKVLNSRQTGSTCCKLWWW